MKAVIIIPTYQEKENITKLLVVVEEELKKANYEFDLLVVDDNSPDGTADLVRGLMKENPRIRLLTGNKKGLGAAYIRGMTYVLEKLNPEVIVEMDADFSHKPKDLPRLLAEVKKGADFVIGSRYTKGGKISGGWSFLRRLNSLWGNRFARYIAGMREVSDCTAGFRAIRVGILKQIKLNELNISGYSFQMRLLYEAHKLHAKIKEIPVEFVDRKKGRTKIGGWDIMEFVIESFRIRKDRILNLETERKISKIL